MEVERRRAKVVLELVVGHQPVMGDVIGESGKPIPFRGWLELAAAIERARLELNGKQKIGVGP